MLQSRTVIKYCKQGKTVWHERNNLSSTLRILRKYNEKGIYGQENDAIGPGFNSSILLKIRGGR
jgi:hypothetical protein